MKERPILFSGEMVRAILDGRKTQTRRLVMMSTCGGHRDVIGRWTAGEGTIDEERAWVERHAIRYADVGDRLWVRETWRPVGPWEHIDPTVAYAAGGTMPVPAAGLPLKVNTNDGRDRWRPSIHMPRWASRLTLKVTSSRIEPLQDITEAGAQEEGVGPDCVTGSYRLGFHALRHEINGVRAPWASNPWVWVIGFRKLS